MDKYAVEKLKASNSERITFADGSGKSDIWPHFDKVGVVFGPIIMYLLYLLTYATIRFLSCRVGVGMGTTTTPTVTGRVWRLRHTVRGGNGVKSLSPCHSLICCLYVFLSGVYTSSPLAILATRRSSIGDRAFMVTVVFVWNELPQNIRSATSLPVFRR